MVVTQAALFELVVDERLEQLERHLLRQAALVQLELGTDDDDRTARVVDALAEQVLAEAALLALEHVGERLERALVRAGDGLAAAAVVEQRVDGLLQHALLVADDDLGSVELLQALQAVVAVDDAAIQIVEIRGREAAAVERDERTQIRRDHRDHLEHHPLGLVADSWNASTTLRRLEIFLRLASEVASRISVRSCSASCGMSMSLQQLADRLGAHAGVERVVAHLLEQLPVALLGEELALLQARLLRVDDDVGLAVEDLLELLERDVEQVADAATAATSGTRCARPAWPA